MYNDVFWNNDTTEDYFSCFCHGFNLVLRNFRWIVSPEGVGGNDNVFSFFLCCGERIHTDRLEGELIRENFRARYINRLVAVSRNQNIVFRVGLIKASGSRESDRGGAGSSITGVCPELFVVTVSRVSSGSPV